METKTVNRCIESVFYYLPKILTKFLLKDQVTFLCLSYNKSVSNVYFCPVQNYLPIREPTSMLPKIYFFIYFSALQHWLHMEHREWVAEQLLVGGAPLARDMFVGAHCNPVRARLLSVLRGGSAQAQTRATAQKLGEPRHSRR